MSSHTIAGSNDALVFRVNADLYTLVWMRNSGGTGSDVATIMLHNDATGDIFVGGNTASTNFPTVSPRQSTRGGNSAGFLQRLTSAGGVTWSSYFSSASSAAASVLCMEFNTARTELYFGGVTTGLAGANISGSGVFDSSHNGSNDFYACRMGIDQTFMGATYLGGSGNEVNIMGLNVDQNNDVYVFRYSNSTNCPEAVVELAEGFAGLVVTTAGTGFGPRDQTPEGTKVVLDREAPGLAEAMRLVNPLGRLSRGVAGTRGLALILNTPGSSKGAVETVEAVLDVIPHALRLMTNDSTQH